MQPDDRLRIVQSLTVHGLRVALSITGSDTLSGLINNAVYYLTFVCETAEGRGRLHRPDCGNTQGRSIPTNRYRFDQLRGDTRQLLGLSPSDSKQSTSVPMGQHPLGDPLHSIGTGRGRAE